MLSGVPRFCLASAKVEDFFQCRRLGYGTQGWVKFGTDMLLKGLQAVGAIFPCVLRISVAGAVGPSVEPSIGGAVWVCWVGFLRSVSRQSVVFFLESLHSA